MGIRGARALVVILRPRWLFQAKRPLQVVCRTSLQHGCSRQPVRRVLLHQQIHKADDSKKKEAEVVKR
jgi:hypothetical protein